MGNRDFARSLIRRGAVAPVPGGRTVRGVLPRAAYASLQTAPSTAVSAPAGTLGRHRPECGSRSRAGCGTQTDTPKKDLPGVCPGTTGRDCQSPSFHPPPRSPPESASAARSESRRLPQRPAQPRQIRRPGSSPLDAYLTAWPFQSANGRCANSASVRSAGKPSACRLEPQAAPWLPSSVLLCTYRA